MGQLFFDRAFGSGVGGGLQGVQIAARFQGQAGRRFDEFLEFIVAGNEIGFGVDFDQSAGGAVDGNPDQAFRSYPARLLGRRRQALGAKPVHRRLMVAIGFDERLLAIHHAGAGLLA